MLSELVIITSSLNIENYLPGNLLNLLVWWIFSTESVKVDTYNIIDAVL